MSTTAVYLTDAEADLFKKFRQYQDDWTKLEPALADPTVRSVTIHMDEYGIIRKIETQQIRFIK